MKVFIVTFIAASVLIANVNCNGCGGGGHATLISADQGSDGGAHGGWGGAVDAGWAGGHGGASCGGHGGGWANDGGAAWAGGNGGDGGDDGGLVNAGACGGSGTDLYRVYGQPIQVSPEATQIVVPASPIYVKPVLVSHGAPVSINPTILTKSAPANVAISPVAIKLLRQYQQPSRTVVVQAPGAGACGCGGAGCSGCGGGH